MKELSPSRIERINRLELVRYRKRAELTPVQKWNRFGVAMLILGALLILACVLIVKAEWSPGNQAAIMAEYKAYSALRHDAMTVEEWK